MQKVIMLPISKLSLWTENPRDYAIPNLSDEEIIMRAIDDPSNNWELDKLLKEIGNEYHYNELPTVVLINGKYIVYDGNRRVALLKCIQSADLFSIATGKLPCFLPSSTLIEQNVLPCNVCDIQTALDIVERKHKGSKNWGMLQLEWFRHFHRNQSKGILMTFNELIPNIVEEYPKLNEEYVVNRLLTNQNLENVGLHFEDGVLSSVLDKDSTFQLIRDIAAVRNQDLSNARNNPGKLYDSLLELNEDKYKQMPKYNPEKGKVVSTQPVRENAFIPEGKKQKKVNKKDYGENTLFGGKLNTCGTRSNQVYRGIIKIDSCYRKNTQANECLVPIMAMSMRLFLDLVSKEYLNEIDPAALGDNSYKNFIKNYVKPHFKEISLFRFNDLALTSDWLNGDYNFEAILGKFAHGSISCSYSDVIKSSKVIGDIIRAFWQKG